jgi:Ca2+-transporting ATPase
MLLVITITFVLQILIIQFAGAFFGTIPLDLMMWLKIFGVTFSVVLVSELVKLIWRILKNN